MADEQPKIVVEVPSDRGYSPLPPPQSNKLEEFKKGWINAIALPDNIPDLAYELTSTVAIPALLSSCWVTLPLPGFVRLGVWGVLAVSGIMVFYIHQAIPEVKDFLLLRVGLIAVGVLLGL
ncbi:hypothetical protein VF14_31025 [Nostoc linckia z18]|uniref:Uncharacterized protein n=2 Tax=Nostoc linckia TaxID=92942 RepID=A0A9Q5Z678_NOSLI|nr:hypothetical protein [Nostoc linckia]PHK30547.1 hypothetical protein VF12_29455 [Nostoc linckia z15]PHK42313.1 hypothetical protein VF13_29865 [Nostoc linckia z16]PHJ56041.1 hypothetical protein VF02_34425 [Nostoc linckia z1]PHJ67637.1 hypothetical protein VF05_16495 [Nostoc linckia z3]PHJ77168.1 hypothetical protein VF03_04730 [Nostoc linckia z2]